MKTKNILMLALLSLILVNPVMAQDQIEITEFNMPEQSEQGDEITVTTRAEVDNKEVEVMGLDWGEGIQEKSCGEPVYCEKEWIFSIDDVGTQSVEATAEDEDGLTDSKTKDITIEGAEAFFDVDITGANTPVVQGDVLRVDYSVENTGSAQGTQDIVLTADDEGRDSTSTLLSSGRSTEGSLEWDTTDSERGWYNVEVSSDDDSDNEWIYIQESDDEDEWNIVSSNAEHVGGGEVEMNLELDNNLPSDYTCRWSRNSGISISDDVMDRSDDTIFEASGSFSEGSHSVWIGCLDGSGSLVTDVVEESFTVDIDDEAFFDVEITGTNSPVEEEQTLEVDYSVENTGDESDFQRVRLEIDGERKDSRWISLSRGSETSGTFEWETEVSDAGSYIATVRSDDSEGSRSVTVNEEGVERPEITSFTSTVDERDVDFDLRLDRDAAEDLTCRWSRSQDITISDDVMDRETDSRFSYSRSFDPGTYTVYAGCLDGSNLVTDVVSTSFNVAEDPDEAFFDVDITGTNSPVRAGSSLNVDYNVQNTGGEFDSQDVELYIGVNRMDRDRNVGLSPSSSTTGSLSWHTSRSDAGTYTAEVRTEDDSAFTTVRVTEREPDAYDLDVIVLDDSGSGLDEAEVNVGDRTEFTDGSGRASFTDLEEGTYDVTASKPGFTTEVKRNVEVDRDKTVSIVLRWTDELNADFSFSPERPLVGEDIVFDGSLSDGDVEEYRWDFDDGSSATGRTVLHSYDSPGFYQVNLEVEDAEENTDTESKIVYVRRDGVDPERYDLDVTVRDSETSDRLEGARVSVDGRTRVTDSDGEVEFTLDEGVYDLFTSRTSYRSDSRTVNLDGDKSVSVELEPRDLKRPGDIRIDSIDMPSSVCRGADVDARVTMENTGDFDRSFTLSATGLSNEIDRSFVLDEGEKRTQLLNFISVQGSGNEKVEFTTGDDERTRTVQVRDCPEDEKDISVSARPTQIRIGDSVRVSGYVDNVRRGTQVDIGSNRRHTSLGSTLTRPDGYFQVYVNPDQIGGHTITASAEGMEASTRIEVLPTVSVVSASSNPDRVFEGDTYNVCAEVESESPGPLVVLKEDGQEVDSKYGRGEVCFERRSSPGEYDYEVQAWARGQSSAKRTSVEVLEMDSEARSFPDQIASVRSGSGLAKVELYNNQRELRQYEIELDGIPRDWTSQSRKEVHLDSGERSTQYLYFTPKREGTFQADLVVRAEGEQIYREEIDIRSGGSDRPPSRWERIKNWLRYR